MMLTEYDEQCHIDMEKEISREEGRQEGRIEGKIEGRIGDILELLGEFGTVPGEIESRIKEEKNEEVLSAWLKLAARAESIEEFIEKSGVLVV